MVEHIESDNVRYLIKMELTYLREELHNLKTCQIQFVTLAFTVTGIIFSLQASTISRISPLIPLVIIIPTWWIFFDKAKSVSRIVGYYRILEKVHLDKKKLDFIGWENAQLKYRERENSRKKILTDHLKSLNKTGKEIPKGLHGVLNGKSRKEKIEALCGSSYWTLVYFTFFSLPIVCFLLYILLNYNNKGIQILEIFRNLNEVELVVIFLSLIAFLVSAYRNKETLLQLIWGEHSYDANEIFWEEILS